MESVRSLAFAAVAALAFAVSAALTVRWTQHCMMGSCADFLIMWTVMMVAMMLPSLAAVLARHRQKSLAVFKVTLGYFTLWSLAGLLVFPLNLSGGWLLVVAGALQLTKWKRRHLDCCRSAPSRLTFRSGLTLGLHCFYCCAPLTLALLVLGMMNLTAMIVVTLAITAERLIPNGARIAQVVGVGLIAAGALLWA